jgi:hypothetical protein
MISGFPFRFEARRLTWNGRGILLRELSKEPTGLYLADLQDRLATRVATLPGYWDRVHVESFVSGDSQRIFFTSPKEEPSTLMIADRGQKKILRAPVSDRSCSEFETSGDGNRVAWVEPAGFDAGDRAVVLDLQAGELLQVQFEQPQTRPWAEGCGGRLSISPDGHRLACVVRSANGDGEILLLDLDTGTVLNVSGSLAEDRNPCLAQGGRLVLFSSDRDRGNSLYLADAEAGTLAKVVKQTGGGCAPWITEDGSQVFFALEGALWRKDLKSGQEAKVIGSETENVYGASISADGKRALVNWIERETRRSRITLHELSSQ